MLKKKRLKDGIETIVNLNMLNGYKKACIDIFYEQQEAISANKFDLGLAKEFRHKIHLKDNNPVYGKQLKVPEAHQLFMEWLKFGMVKGSNSLYNSAIF